MAEIALDSSSVEPKPSLLRPSLVIVAGPMGAGKTTFAGCLYEERLPKEISDNLPENASFFPFAELKYLEVRHPSPRIPPGERRAAKSGDGQAGTYDDLIVECAINKISEQDIGPTVRRIVRLSNGDVYFVTVILDGNVLARRYFWRYWNPSVHFTRSKRNPNGSWLRGVYSYAHSTLKPKKLLQVFRYRWTQSVAASYAAWNDFVKSLPSDVSGGSRRYVFLSVQPCLDAEGKKSFRLVEQRQQ